MWSWPALRRVGLSGQACRISLSSARQVPAGFPARNPLLPVRLPVARKSECAKLRRLHRLAALAFPVRQLGGQSVHAPVPKPPDRHPIPLPDRIPSQIRWPRPDLSAPHLALLCPFSFPVCP